MGPRKTNPDAWEALLSPGPQILLLLCRGLVLLARYDHQYFLRQAAGMGSTQLKHMDEALLGQPVTRSVSEDCKGCGPWLLTMIGFLWLTFNSGMAVYRSNGNLVAISFIGFSYLDLVLLFYCLRLYERTPTESPRREHLKMAVWLLTTMLTAAFSYKVAAIMPFPVQVLVWTMAGATVLGGFYAFFLYGDGTKA